MIKFGFEYIPFDDPPCAQTLAEPTEVAVNTVFEEPLSVTLFMGFTVPALVPKSTGILLGTYFPYMVKVFCPTLFMIRLAVMFELRVLFNTVGLAFMLSMR